MSKVNGEKARAAIAKRNRTARRVKDRARLAEIKAGSGKQDAEKGPTSKPKSAE